MHKYTHICTRTQTHTYTPTHTHNVPHNKVHSIADIKTVTFATWYPYTESEKKEKSNWQRTLSIKIEALCQSKCQRFDLFYPRHRQPILKSLHKPYRDDWGSGCGHLYLVIQELSLLLCKWTREEGEWPFNWSNSLFESLPAEADELMLLMADGQEIGGREQHFLKGIAVDRCKYILVYHLILVFFYNFFIFQKYIWLFFSLRHVIDDTHTYRNTHLHTHTYTHKDSL